MTVKDVEGTDQLIKKLQRLAGNVTPQQCEAALMAGGLVIQSSAVRKARVLTGTLRRSIHTETKQTSDGAVAQVGTDVEYAVYNEFGTRTMRAQPFLRPAFDEERLNALKEIERALETMVTLQ